MPSTTIERESPESTESAPAPSPRSTAHRSRKIVTRLNKAESEVEPANAKLMLKDDAYVFEKPTKWSKHIDRVHAPKYVVVTGSTLSYVQIRLKDGRVGYVPQSAVDMVKRTDKVFALTQDAAVRSVPNAHGKQVAEVHRGHSVYAIGISLNYLKIKMKNGTEGFIPLTAVQ